MNRYIISAINFIKYLFKDRWLNDTSLKVYHIPAHHHYARESYYRPVKLRSLHFIASFNDTCKYATMLPANQNDINKLYGFTDGGILPHKNSARIGWNYVGDGKIQLHAYAYAKGERNYKKLGLPISFFEVPELTITPTFINGQNLYQFDMKLKEVTSTVFLPRGIDNGIIEGVLLYPYFGGDERPQHEVVIQIKNL